MKTLGKDILNTCCGCFACKQSCPKQCITIQKNELGFYYPFINKDNCIECGRCVDVCQIYHVPTLNRESQCYSYVSPFDDTLNNSSSGGAFYDIAERFLENDGVVYGCAFNDQLSPEHIRVGSKESLNRLRGSKYVQSDTSRCFKHIKTDLTNKKKVLFSGTPCQVYGLMLYLKNTDISNLYTIDLVCHGVPSSEFLHRYIVSLERKKRDTLEKISFRLKNNYSTYNKTRFNETLHWKSGNTTIKPYYKSFYYFYFLNKLNYRISCYSCIFAQKNRIGDLTLGDFWGITRHGKKERDYGCSLILCNSAKGKDILSNISEYIVLEDINVALKGNEQLVRPSKMPSSAREKLIAVYNKDKSGDKLEKFYSRKFRVARLIAIIKRNTPRFIKKVINYGR